MADKPDFRKKLNILLGIFYQNGTVAVAQLVRENNTGLTEAELYASFETLITDGHIQYINARDGWKDLKVGVITGRGRVFYEQGSYRDQRNKVDQTIDWFKNKWVFAVIFLAVIGITSIWGIVEIIIKVAELFHK